jgi:cytochrome c biogenesis protein CcdA
MREAVFLVIGLSTPLGILAVNGSAFIMDHLEQFRVAIGICALASGLSLNGLGAWAALSRGRRFAPDLYAEYRYWLVSGAVLFVIAWSVLGAYLTYESMKDRHQLPNLYAVLTALWLIFLPVAITFISRRINLTPADRPPAPEATRP